MDSDHYDEGHDHCDLDLDNSVVVPDRCDVDQDHGDVIPDRDRCEIDLDQFFIMLWILNIWMRNVIWILITIM